MRRPLVSEHFGENPVNLLLILLRNDGALKFVRFFSGQPCIANTTMVPFISSALFKFRYWWATCLFLQTCTLSENVADMLLSTLVQRIEKQLKLLRRLATEH